LAVKKYHKTFVLLCFLAGGCVTHNPIEKAHSDELKRLGMLRENMPRSQVEKILQPLKEGPGYVHGPIERTFYRLSFESGVWITYIRGSEASPEDKLARSGGGSNLGVWDDKTGKWSEILVPLRK
jgi:hypothetical protein